MYDTHMLTRTYARTHTHTHTHTHKHTCREGLCSVLLALELHLGEISTTGEKLATYHDITIQLDRKADIFREAVNTPDHPLISMQDK